MDASLYFTGDIHFVFFWILLSQERLGLIHDAVNLLVEHHIKTPQQIVDDLCFPAQDIIELCGVKETFFSAGIGGAPRLRVVR